MMKYHLELAGLRAATDTDRLLFALTERLERIADLMERATDKPDEHMRLPT